MEKNKNKIAENNIFINNDLTVDNEKKTNCSTSDAFVDQMTSISSSFSFQQKKQEQKCLFSSPPFLNNSFSVGDNYMPINNLKQNNNFLNCFYTNVTQNHDIISPSTSLTSVTSLPNAKKNTISVNQQLLLNLQAQTQQWTNQMALNSKAKASEMIPLNHTTQYNNMNNQLQSMQMPSPSILCEDDGIIDNPQVDLEDKHLWNTFNSCINEMIITKSGRQIFTNYKKLKIIQIFILYNLFIFFSY